MNGNANPAAQDAEFSRFMVTQNGQSGQIPGDAFAMDAMQREIAAFHQHQQRSGSNSGSGSLTPSNPGPSICFASLLCIYTDFELQNGLDNSQMEAQLSKV